MCFLQICIKPHFLCEAVKILNNTLETEFQIKSDLEITGTVILL